MGIIGDNMYLHFRWPIVFHHARRVSPIVSRLILLQYSDIIELYVDLCWIGVGVLEES